MAEPERSPGAARTTERAPRARAVAVVVVVVTAVVVAVVAWTVAGTDQRPDGQRLPEQDLGPTRSETVPAPSAWRWTDPPRPQTRQMVAAESQETGSSIAVTHEDGLDAHRAWVDIDVVSATRDQRRDDRWSWTLELGEAPPRAAAPDPSRRSVAYGLVIDGDGDLEADCMIGLDNDAPILGDHRVWVTDVGTGATEVRDHPPYGFPIEFLHPDEVGARAGFDEPTVLFLIVRGRVPCEEFGPWASFYAWASDATEDSGTTWDFAPDDAWLPMP